MTLFPKSAFQDGCTALMWASRYEHSATVKLLLDKGAKIDIADKVRHLIRLQYVIIDHILYGEIKRANTSACTSSHTPCHSALI